MSKTTQRQLRSLELFAGCRRGQITAIDHLGTVVDRPPDRVLCREGAPGREFFLLLDGVACAQSDAGLASMLLGGAWFGEIALLGAGRRRRTVTTVTATRLLVFDRAEFASLLLIAPQVRRRLEQSAALAQRIDRPTFDSWYVPVTVDDLAVEAWSRA